MNSTNSIGMSIKFCTYYVANGHLAGVSIKEITMQGKIVFLVRISAMQRRLAIIVMYVSLEIIHTYVFILLSLYVAISEFLK